MTVYYWNRGFVLLAPTFVLDRTRHPYRRLSATLLIARGKPFLIEIGDGTRLTTRAALVGPKVSRRRIAAVDSELAIFDLGIETPECAALVPLLRGQPIVALDANAFSPLQPPLTQAAAGVLSCEGVRELTRDAVQAVTGRPPGVHVFNPRVEQVLHLIHALPLREVRLETLARQVHLSASRLRHLFREQTGCSLSHYARWASVWRAATLWVNGAEPWTDIAHQAGFCDLAHLDRAFNEVFGLNPSTVTDPRHVTLIRCVDPVRLGDAA